MLKKVGKKSKKNEAGRKSYIYDALSKTICNIIHHCVKSVCIRSFSGPYFPALDSIRRDAGRLSVFTPNARKYGQEKIRIRRRSALVSF